MSEWDLIRTACSSASPEERDLPRTHPLSLPAPLLSSKTLFPGITEVAPADRELLRKPNCPGSAAPGIGPQWSSSYLGQGSVLFDSLSRGGRR